MKINNPEAWGVAKDFGKKVLKELDKLGVRTTIVGTTGASVIETNYAYFLLSDNGGEVNLNKVNSGDQIHSIPYTIFRTPISPATLAWRIVQKIEGKTDGEIDWEKQL
jgi:hypothetical protein